MHFFTFLQTQLASSPNWRCYLSQAVELKAPLISGQIVLCFGREEGQEQLLWKSLD